MLVIGLSWFSVVTVIFKQSCLGRVTFAIVLKKETKKKIVNSCSTPHSYLIHLQENKTKKQGGSEGFCASWNCLLHKCYTRRWLVVIWQLC